MADLLWKALVVARVAHRGQLDKNGVDYFEHVQAVARMVEGDDAKMAAYLHDVVEDTPVSLHDLRELGFPAPVLDAVRLLTHTHEQSHSDYVRAIRDATSPGAELARAVKRADLAHNADPARAIPGDRGWLKRRYEKATAILDGVVP